MKDIDKIDILTDILTVLIYRTPAEERNAMFLAIIKKFRDGLGVLEFDDVKERYR